LIINILDFIFFENRNKINVKLKYKFLIFYNIL
jgi:hypothetical protein